MRIRVETGEKLSLTIEHGEYASFFATASMDLQGRNSITLAELRALIGRLDSVAQERNRDGLWAK